MTTWVSIDIESIPDPSLPEELKPQPALGNYKDPEKIAAKVAEWEAGGQVKAMSVNPMMNKVICVAMFGTLVSQAYYAQDSFDEKEMIREVWRCILHGGEDGKPLSIITSYGRKFDIPTLLARGIMYGVLSTSDVSQIDAWDLQPWYKTQDYHIDIHDHWDYPLDFLAQRLLGEKKLGHGSEVYPMYLKGEREKIEKYCLKDAELAYRVAEKCHLI